MIHEHDRIVLRNDLPDNELYAGDVGTVVHVYDEGRAYEVEFCTLRGDTVTVATVSADHVRPVDENDVTHARSRSRPAK